MNYRALGRSGLQVSEISLGSWLTLGSSVDGDRTREIVHRAYDLGINFFDTADVYANGRGEETLGRALSEIPRHAVVIATKAFSPCPNAPTIEACHASTSSRASTPPSGDWEPNTSTSTSVTVPTLRHRWRKRSVPTKI